MATELDGQSPDGRGGAWKAEYGEEPIPRPDRVVPPARMPERPPQRLYGGRPNRGWRGLDRLSAAATPRFLNGVGADRLRILRWRGGEQVGPPSPETMARFYKEATTLKGHTDRFAFDGDFKGYYPVYEDMSPEQRRGYFSWRTAWRAGEARAAPLSFVYVHAYELLMLVGVESPEAGMAELERVVAAYPEKSVRRNVGMWMRDFAVYYGLGGAWRDRLFAEDIARDRIQITLARSEAAGDGELFAAVVASSTRDMGSSIFFRKEPGRAAAVVAAAFREAERRHRARLGTANVWYLPEMPREHPCYLFSNAVFHDWKRYEDYSYEVDPARIYHCRKGIWTLEGWETWRGPVRSRRFSALLAEADRQLREAFPGRARPLKKATDDREVEEVVAFAVRELVAAEREAARPVVRIDRGRLDGIRRDAEVTQKALLAGSEEGERPTAEAEDEPQAVPVTEATKPVEPPKKPAPTVAEPAVVTGLTAMEKEFVRLVAAGGDAASFLRGRGLLAAAVMESVNEKLMDLLNDVALEEDGSGRPQLVEDYRDQVLRAVGRET